MVVAKCRPCGRVEIIAGASAVGSDGGSVVPCQKKSMRNAGDNGRVEIRCAMVRVNGLLKQTAEA